MSKRTIHLALVLIIVGAYLLLLQLNIGVPDLQEIWPALPCAAGIFFLSFYVSGQQRDPGLVFIGTALTLSALFFFLITMGSPNPDYTVLEYLWPVFVVIAGISFLALWLAQGLEGWEVIFLAVVSIVLGGTSLALNLKPGLSQELSRLWPALLILVGLILISRVILSKRKPER